MPKVDVYNTDKKKVGEVDLADAIFGTEVKEHLFHAAVRYQMAARRAGTTKSRVGPKSLAVAKKPYRQKGTGRARQGTRRAVQFRGGGVVHGPTTGLTRTTFRRRSARPRSRARSAGVPKRTR